MKTCRNATNAHPTAQHARALTARENVTEANSQKSAKNWVTWEHHQNAMWHNGKTSWDLIQEHSCMPDTDQVRKHGLKTAWLAILEAVDYCRRPLNLGQKMQFKPRATHKTCSRYLADTNQSSTSIICKKYWLLQLKSMSILTTWQETLEGIIQITFQVRMRHWDVADSFLHRSQVVSNGHEHQNGSGNILVRICVQWTVNYTK